MKKYSSSGSIHRPLVPGTDTLQKGCDVQIQLNLCTRNVLCITDTISDRSVLHCGPLSMLQGCPSEGRGGEHQPHVRCHHLFQARRCDHGEGTLRPSSPLPHQGRHLSNPPPAKDGQQPYRTCLRGHHCAQVGDAHLTCSTLPAPECRPVTCNKRCPGHGVSAVTWVERD